MATVGQDFFTDAGANTALTAHTPDVGATWTVEAANFTIPTNTNEVSHSGTVTQRARKGDNLGTDTHTVSAKCKKGQNATRLAGVCARMNINDYTNQYEAYIVRNLVSTADVFLFKNVAGTRTQLGTASITLDDNVYGTLRLTIRNGTQEVFWNDVSVISTTEANSTLAGNSYAGIIMNGNAQASVRVDNFLSEYDVPVPQLLQGQMGALLAQ